VGAYHPLLPTWLPQWAQDMGCREAIETRTFTGDSAALLHAVLGRCTSIDRTPHNTESARFRFSGHPGLTLVGGEPRDVLPEIVSDTHEPFLFWFNGHIDSSGSTDQTCPILDEIASIADCPTISDSVVAVDDARLFGFPHNRHPAEPYFPRLIEVLEAIEKLGLTTFIADDVIVGVPHDCVAEFRALCLHSQLLQARPITVVQSADANSRLERRLQERLVGLAARSVHVRLTGRAGNQLFQYAAALSVAGDRAVRLVRADGAGQQHHLGLDLLIASPLPMASKLERRLFDVVVPDPTLADTGATTRIQQVVRRILAPSVVRTHGHLSRSFSPRPQATNVPIGFMDGAFQHSTWFKPGDDIVVAALLASAPARWQERITDQPYAAISLRFKDYVDLGWLLGDGYYDRAVAHLDLSLPVVVVSDDKEQAARWRSRLRQAGRTVIELPPVATTPAVEDFWLLAGAQQVVISNSTFAWWAARVGDAANRPPSPARTVVAPKDWILGFGRACLEPAWLRM